MRHSIVRQFPGFLGKPELVFAFRPLRWWEGNLWFLPAPRSLSRWEPPWLSCVALRPGRLRPIHLLPLPWLLLGTAQSTKWQHRLKVPCIVLLLHLQMQKFFGWEEEFHHLQQLKLRKINQCLQIQIYCIGKTYIECRLVHLYDILPPCRCLRSWWSHFLLLSLVP